MVCIDHNTLQSGFENADDHNYIMSVAKKHGIYASRPGNGICHQVNLERFGYRGATLLGSDSHTPTGGGIGMIAIGAGGLDVAVAMGGGAYYLNCPKFVNVELKGRLRPGVSAKDVILEVLRVMSVKGGVGKIIEYTGEGVKPLSVPERATITNMGAELGATTSIFPSDEVTREFLAAQGREADFTPLAADADAEYDEHIVMDLSALTPMAAMPHHPDNVKTIEEIGKIKVDQVCIGSCTNASCRDLMRVAAILQRKNGESAYQPYHLARLQAGHEYARQERCAEQYDRRGRACPRMRLRAVHRHGAVPGDGCGLGAHLQPQFLRTQRDKDASVYLVSPRRRR